MRRAPWSGLRRVGATAGCVATLLVILSGVVSGGASSAARGEDAPVSSDGAAAELRRRGEYLAVAGNCASCHTVAGGAFMAGGLPFHTPFGTIYSTNITPDGATGIGRWSEDDFLASMREGVRPNGEHLYPVFPYTHFTRVTDGDIAALFAYLRSLPPVARTNDANELDFPFSQRALLGVWKALFFEPGAFEADPARSAQWNRGAYLVEGLAHCSACHSPRNALGAEDLARSMSGGEYHDRVGEEGAIRPWSAPDLTGSARGLGLWPAVELSAYLATGRNAFLESFGPMNEVIMNSTRHLDGDDIEAMATYLKALPAGEEPIAAVPDGVTMGRGRTVYNLHCGTCHLPTGEGDPEMGPKLNNASLVVQAENPASLINAILYSPEAPEGLPPKWRKPMEEFQYLLDDEEVAAVATFVRNSWNNRAGVVTPAQVAEQR